MKINEELKENLGCGLLIIVAVVFFLVLSMNSEGGTSYENTSKDELRELINCHEDCLYEYEEQVQCLKNAMEEAEGYTQPWDDSYEGLWEALEETENALENFYCPEPYCNCY